MDDIRPLLLIENSKQRQEAREKSVMLQGILGDQCWGFLVYPDKEYDIPNFIANPDMVIPDRNIIYAINYGTGEEYSIAQLDSVVLSYIRNRAGLSIR